MASSVPNLRPNVNGKFLFLEDKKYFVRGTTYGPFKPDADGCEYHYPELAARDFAQMASIGVNTVRTYTVPPVWLLDIAAQNGLRVMIGLPWEQHITFLDDKDRHRAIEDRIRKGVQACAGHPAVLCYAIGNEIPSPIVRWHGRRSIERFLKRLYQAAKDEDPQGLITYVNYPTTEYLQLPFLDFACYNVYLEQQDRLEAYIARLHNVAEDKPLVLAEIGLDSLRNGEETQAETLDWQVRTAFAQGCAGAFIFSWTDEWHRGGEEILDWNFGLTDRDRRPKQAMKVVSEVFSELPFPNGTAWPRISVVVCSYNGARTIQACCDGLNRLEYPNYEVIVVDDGSQDGTGDIAANAGFRVIRTSNQGLSAARNTGIRAAAGEIIAFIDDDAYPDPHWLTYLAATFESRSFAAVGGPNPTPENVSMFSKCVGAAPGGPVHVLLTDSVAEHIPGVNMAFRKACLEEIGGFDPQFRTAGDDVDVCWRLQDQGWELGFNPAAVVWHYRRDSVQTYWRQQAGYGKAEGLLEQKWPEKYNAAGHVTWNGRVYGNGVTEWLPWRRGRVYQGTWGTAAFQSIYQPAHTSPLAIVMMPEWYLIVIQLGLFAALGFIWRPMFIAVPFFILAVGLVLAQVGVYSAKSIFVLEGATLGEKIYRGALLAPLCLLQPLARLAGRLRSGLTFFRRRERRKGERRNALPYLVPKLRSTTIWSEQWQSNIDWLHIIESRLQEQEGALVKRSGTFDRWDLEVRTGQLSCVRLLTTIEEHGGGHQLIRCRTWTTFPLTLSILWLSLILVAVSAGLAGLWVFSVVLAVILLLVGARILLEGAQTTAAIFAVCEDIAQEQIEAINRIRARAPKKESSDPVRPDDGQVDREIMGLDVDPLNRTAQPGQVETQ